MCAFLVWLPSGRLAKLRPQGCAELQRYVHYPSAVFDSEAPAAEGESCVYLSSCTRLVRVWCVLVWCVYLSGVYSSCSRLVCTCLLVLVWCVYLCFFTRLVLVWCVLVFLYLSGVYLSGVSSYILVVVFLYSSGVYLSSYNPLLQEVLVFFRRRPLRNLVRISSSAPMW